MGRQREYRERIYETYVSRGDSVALSFDRTATARRARYLKPLLRGWLPESKSSDICDLASGGGEVLFALRSYGYQGLSGVDVSTEQVSSAQQEFGSAVSQGDVVEHLASRPGAYDLLLAMDVIEHRDKEEVLPFLDACHTSLRPGGRLVLQTPNAESPYALGVRYGDLTDELAFTPDSLARVLQASSLSEIEVRECGPRPLGMASLLRTIAWKFVRAGVRLRNRIETGSPGGGVHTRVFLSSGTR